MTEQVPAEPVLTPPQQQQPVELHPNEPQRVSAHPPGPHSHVPRPGHMGHEAYHQWLMLFVIVSIFGFQIFLVWWKKNRYSQFLRVSLAGLWLIPAIFSVTQHFWRFLIFWSVFSVGATWLLVKASRKPLPRDTPGLVYTWFFRVYRLSYAVSVTGLFLLLADAFRITAPITNTDIGGIGGLLLFYGLYFGVMTRDCAELCTDRMAGTLGYNLNKDLPNKSLPQGLCAVCTQPLRADATNSRLLGPEDEASKRSKHATGVIVKLDCGHEFHDFCIRGFVLIGKKDVCPHCSERVDTRHIRRGYPWQAEAAFYVQMLDAVRYLVVWNPILFVGLQIILNVLDQPDSDV